MKDGLEPKFMSIEDGGLVEEQIKKYRYCIFRCTCKTVIDNPNFEGYPHDGGVQDKIGTKWWLYIKCPSCGYDWALKKLDKQILKYDDSDVTNRYELFYEEVTKISIQKLLDNVPSPYGAAVIVYSIKHVGRKVIITPIVTDGSHSPMEHVKSVVAKLKPACYVVVMEGWMQKRKKEDLPDIKRNYHYGDLEKAKDKSEVLFVTGRTQDGQFDVTKMYQIFKDSEQKVTKVEEFKDYDMAISKKIP